MPEDGWHQIVPTGEFLHAESGVLQIIDDQAIKEMERHFRQEKSAPNFPGLLVDFDHFSHDADKPSEAAGWIEDVRSETGTGCRAGLWARIRWSDSGEAAVKGGRYRLVSPVWLAEDCEAVDRRAGAEGMRSIRPLRLHRLALTNDPRLRGMLPLSHRDRSTPANACCIAGKKTIAEPETVQRTPKAGGEHIQPQTKESMKNLTQILGLAEGVPIESVVEEITRLKNRAAEAENQVQQYRSQAEELLTAQVQQDLERFSGCFKPEARSKWQSALMANRSAAMELLESIAMGGGVRRTARDVSPATTALHHRAAAKSPPAESGPFPSHSAEQVRQVREYQNRQECSWQEAWDAVKAEHPNLFKAGPEIQPD